MSRDSQFLEDEEKLVELLVNKDREAFRYVFDSYFEIMVLYAARFMDTIEEAEEISQDVFVKFWEKCATLNEGSSIKSYLYRSVHNACLNQLKHEKVKNTYRQHVIHFLESSYETEPQQDEEFIHERIFQEINQLPPRCSEIFKLSRFEGLQYQEIADHLEISIKTVEVQMGKALKTLREKLEDLKHKAR